MEIVHYITEEGVDPYQNWVDRLRDVRARVAILRRLDRVAAGNLGDHKPCRGGVCELRIDHGPGYRVYYFTHGTKIVVLLCGGDKASQEKDITMSLKYKADYLRRIKEVPHE